MPLVRIDLSKNASSELVRTVSEAVYSAMVEIENVPLHDKFQIVTRHDIDELVYPSEGYLGVKYSRDIIFIQVTWVAGRATDVKKRFYKKIADDIHANSKVRKEDMFISLVDSNREDLVIPETGRCSTRRSDREPPSLRPSMGICVGAPAADLRM